MGFNVLNFDLMTATWDTIIINPSFLTCPNASPDSLVIIRDSISVAISAVKSLYISSHGQAKGD